MILIMQERVHDYAAWKTVFDRGEDLRVRHGCSGHVILRSDSDTNDLTIHLRFPSREAVDGFLADPQLMANMERAGVEGKPAVSLVHEEETELYASPVAA
jgi:hypothetical protein